MICIGKSLSFSHRRPASPMQAAKDNERRLKQFLALGADLAGGAIGTGAGLLIGGVEGAFLGRAGGTVATRILRTSALDLLQRCLSDAEQRRMAGVLLVAAERIQQKLSQGYEPRHDDFFTGEPRDRSAAEEIAKAYSSLVSGNTKNGSCRSWETYSRTSHSGMRSTAARQTCLSDTRRVFPIVNYVSSPCWRHGNLRRSHGATSTHRTGLHPQLPR